MEGNLVRSRSGFDSRRAFRFLQYGAQLRLPLYLFLITAGFMSLFAAHSRSAYADLYAMVMTNVPEAFQGQILEQTRDFSIVGAAILVGYVIALLGFCVAYTHTLLGPTIALRRHVQAMKDGDYGSRTTLRKSDAAHQGLADDLNELAQILSDAEKGGSRVQGR